MPIHANPCQSCANRGPFFRSDTNLPICQSWPIRANPVPIGQFGANQPIQCQSSANRPIRSQSGANRTIRCQSTNSVPILSQIPANPCQSSANRGSIFHSNSVPIGANHGPIGQSGANPVPIGQSGANPVPIGQSSANPVPICQFKGNPALKYHIMAYLSVQVSMEEPLNDALQLKVDWHSIDQDWYSVQPILEILIY